MSNNLTKHQWQIGNLVIGRGTQYEVLGVGGLSYDMNVQDSQIPLSDKITMALDSRKAMPLTFTVGVKDNAPQPNIATSLPADLVTKSSKLLGVLQDEWYADDIKQQWGQYKPLIYCDGYGVTKMIWGRPGKFQYTPKTKTSQWRKVVAEFRRLDTLCYSEIETATIDGSGASTLVEGAAPVYYSVGGDANSPFRVLLTGPMSNPLVTLGSNQIQLNMDINAGVVVEVNSYPWSQRIIDSNNVSWRTKLVGQTKYLDQLLLPKNTQIPMSWSASSTSSASSCVVLWRDTYNVI